MLDETAARERLAALCVEAGGPTSFARVTGLSRTHIVNAIDGRRAIGPKLQRAIGLERVVAYKALRP